MINENKAKLRYSSVAPSDSQAEQIKKALAKKFNNPDLELEIIPLQKNAEIYIEKWPEFSGREIAALHSVSFDSERKFTM